MSLRRILGNIVIVFGSFYVLIAIALKLPFALRLELTAAGALFIGVGAILRNSEGALWNRLKLLFRSSGGKVPKTAGKSGIDPMLAVRVLRLASQKGGRLTVAQAAIELDVPLDQAEKALDECAAKGSAYIDVDASTGIASYRFPEFITK